MILYENSIKFYPKRVTENEQRHLYLLYKKELQ